MDRGAVLTLPVLLAVAMGRCLSFGECGPYYEDALWTEPGLFEEMGWWAPLDPQQAMWFPLTHPDAEGRWGPHYVVSRVIFGPDHIGREGLQVRLEPASGGMRGPDGAAGERARIVMLGTDAEDDATWRQMIRHFVNETGVAGDDPEAWIEALIASRSVAGEASAGDPSSGFELHEASHPVERLPNLTMLAQRLGPTDGPSTGPAGTWLRWSTDEGTWTFVLELTTRTLLIESTAPGEQETLTVSARDRVRVTIQQDIGHNETAVKEWLRQRFQANDLPEPTFEGFWIGATVC